MERNYALNNTFAFGEFIKEDEFRKLSKEAQNIIIDLFDAATKSGVMVQDAAKILLKNMAKTAVV